MVNLRERVLADCAALKVPLRAEQLDALLSRATQEGLSHLEFVHRLLSDQADQRRERSIAHRIHEARFRDPHSLAQSDRFSVPFRNLHKAQSYTISVVLRRAMPHFSQFDGGVYSDLHDRSRQEGLRSQDAEAIL